MTQHFLQSNVNSETWIVTVLGVSVVFLGLIMIIALLYLMRAALSIKIGKKNKPEQNESSLQPQAQPVAIENREELVAAISAAIAEEIGTDISAIRIISLKQIS